MDADAQNFWFAIISLTVAVASTVVNLFVVRSQIGLQLAELKSGIDESVIGWGEQAIEAVARAQFLAVRCQDAPDDDAFTNELRAHSEALSACVDHGRLFFPNEDPDSQGAERAGAFQGVRPPILDAMVFSCLMLGQLASLGPAERRARSSDAADFLNHCRRLVVTELQNAIDPRHKEKLLQQLRAGRRDDPVSTKELAKGLGMRFDEAYPNHPVMKSWTDTHVRGIYPRKEQPPNDLSTRFHRIMWGVGDYLMRSSERALQRARNAKR